MKSYEDSKCRFIKEYANYKIKYYEDLIKTYPSINRKKHQSKIGTIQNAVLLHSRGFITVDECMKIIAGAYD